MDKLIDQHRFKDAFELYNLMKADVTLQPNEETLKIINPCIKFTKKHALSSISQSTKRNKMKTVALEKQDQSHGLVSIDCTLYL